MLKILFVALSIWFLIVWVFLFWNTPEASFVEYEEPASKAAGIFVDQSEHYGAYRENEHEEHDDENHEWHDHD